MGFRTVVVLMNDRASEWENDPALGKRIMLSASMKSTGQVTGARHELPYGEVAEQVHGDTQSLIIADGYSARPVAHSNWRRGDTHEVVEMRLLRELADKHGFDLHKKRSKK
jgi:hypothetical protein